MRHTRLPPAATATAATAPTAAETGVAEAVESGAQAAAVAVAAGECNLSLLLVNTLLRQPRCGENCQRIMYTLYTGS
jgi:hypothetical protein